MEGQVTEHSARVVWEGTKEDLRAHRVEIGGVTVAGSASPQWGGDPAATDPEQMFVAALSACHMLWFLALARERRLRVVSYEDEAMGSLDHDSFAFTGVTLRPRVEFEADPGAEVLDELHHEAHRRCYIANSASIPVEVAA
jgi:organic hydroperoxide reductase OsmC/OhrA